MKILFAHLFHQNECIHLYGKINEMKSNGKNTMLDIESINRTRGRIK